MLMRDYMRALVGSGATIVMDPTVAALLKDVQGFKTKEALSEWFAANVEKTVASFLGNGVASGMSTSFAAQGLEPYATWVKLPPETPIKPFSGNSKAIQIVVVGGKIQTTWFVTDYRLGRGELVDDWR
jgi:hypothetical protein